MLGTVRLHMQHITASQCSCKLHSTAVDI